MGSALRAFTFRLAVVIFLILAAIWYFFGANQFVRKISKNDNDYVSSPTTDFVLLIVSQNESELHPRSNTDKAPRNLYVRMCRTRGRLGNHMFEYASLLGIARRNNRTPVWASLKSDLDETFNLKMKVDRDKERIKRNADLRTFLHLDEEYARCYDKRTEVLPNRNVCLQGYRQSRNYFSNVEAELRTHFTFTDAILDKARLILKEATDRLNVRGKSSKENRLNKTLVAMHVRRGDLLTEGQSHLGWVIPEREFYDRAMNYFNSRYDNVVFILLSDDMPWCEKNIRANNLAYVRGPSVSIDLAIGSLCNHAIITQGTFGLWIAWFTNGETVRPRNALIPGSRFYKEFTECKADEHHYPKNSVLL